MLGITCALYDEAVELIALLNRQKTGSVYHYSGEINGAPVSLFLTGPGLRKNKNQLLRWIKTLQISTLLQTGYCGALTRNFRPGDTCQVNRVLPAIRGNPPNQPSAFTISPAMEIHTLPVDSPTLECPPGDLPQNKALEFHSLLTVDHPILTAEERDDITQNADLVDMEAWHICDLLKANAPGVKTRIVKIVGDVPGDERLMKYEISMRDFFKERNPLGRLKIALKTGPAFCKLYARKRMLQRTLKKAVCENITNLSPRPCAGPGKGAAT